MSRKTSDKKYHLTNHNNRKSSFTRKTYILCLVISIVVLTAAGFYTWSSFNRLNTLENQKDEMTELIGAIIHLDEVLTMSTHMAASTGNLIWEERYLGYESQLDETIQRLKIISQDSIGYQFAEKTDIANVALVALEKKAFDLVRQGNRQPATNLLDSQKYKDLKLSYEEGMTHLRKKAIQRWPPYFLMS